MLRPRAHHQRNHQIIKPWPRHHQIFSAVTHRLLRRCSYSPPCLISAKPHLASATTPFTCSVDPPDRVVPSLPAKLQSAAAQNSPPCSLQLSPPALTSSFAVPSRAPNAASSATLCISAVRRSQLPISAPLHSSLGLSPVKNKKTG